MPDARSTTDRDTVAERQAVMALCAEASAAELAAVLDALAPLSPVHDLRAPASGLVMLRGRAGGDGAVLNLGEATVTRAAVVLGGVSGFAYHLGRDTAKARRAAILDALWQQDGTRAVVAKGLEPVGRRIAAERELAARRAAATRVNFFYAGAGGGLMSAAPASGSLAPGFAHPVFDAQAVFRAVLENGAVVVELAAEKKRAGAAILGNRALVLSGGFGKVRREPGDVDDPVCDAVADRGVVKDCRTT